MSVTLAGIRHCGTTRAIMVGYVKVLCIPVGTSARAVLLVHFGNLRLWSSQSRVFVQHTFWNWGERTTLPQYQTVPTATSSTDSAIRLLPRRRKKRNSYFRSKITKNRRCGKKIRIRNQEAIMAFSTKYNLPVSSSSWSPRPCDLFRSSVRRRFSNWYPRLSWSLSIRQEY